MSKLTWVGLVVLMAGLVSGVLEKTFYGYVDENNVLRESFFLPMAFILVFLGGGLLIIAIARSVGVRWKKRA